MITTQELIETIVRLTPKFEYYFGRLMKLVTKGVLTNYESKVMVELQGSSGISMSELADRLVMSKPNLTANIDVLVKLNFVERIFDENDRRKVIVRLTETGYAYLEQTKCNMAAFFDKNYSSLTYETRDDLYQTLIDLNSIFDKIQVTKLLPVEQELPAIRDKNAPLSNSR